MKPKRKRELKQLIERAKKELNQSQYELELAKLMKQEAVIRIKELSHYLKTTAKGSTLEEELKEEFKDTKKELEDALESIEYWKGMISQEQRILAYLQAKLAEGED
jgi:hypothetical protein